MNYDNSLKFARYLTTTMQYEFASQEYERLNFLYPKDSTTILELVQTYRFSNKCQKLDQSQLLLSKEERIIKNSIFTKEYLNFSLICRTFDEKYDNYSSILTKEEKEFYNLSHYWISSDYNTLSTFTKKKNEKSNFKTNELLSLTYEFNEEKYKSPALALMMSAIIPGSGKAYSNRWEDAFVSLLFVGSNAYASYRAFSKKGTKSVNGWIFGGISLTFYSANLWGSYKAAKNYNKHIKHTYQQNAENIIYSSF